MKSFLIIGMGSFGHHLCRCLARQKCEIMVVDKTGEAIEDMLSLVVSAKIGDCTKPEVLESFGVESFDTCFVCMGSNFQNSLQITSMLKEMGAKRVLSKADEDIHAKFLLRNGADAIIYPEKHIAERIAIEEASDSIFECLDLGEGYYIMEIAPRKEWLGKSIKELKFRNVYHLNIMAVKKEDAITMMPDLDYVFCEEEHILVLGMEEDILKAAEK
ncbi:NAD-binding protein [Anaerotignum sp.]